LVEVSVILPTKNESKTIGTCIKKIKSVFEKYGIDGEIIVSDNSEDETPQIAKALGVKVVTPDRMGYGYAYRYAFRYARGKYIVMGDADDTYDFMEMPKLLEPLMKGEADLVIGSRFKGEIRKGAMPWLHRYIGNPLLTWFLNFFYKAGVSDAHSGFRAIRKDALDKMNLRSSGMEFASEMIIEATKLGLRIKEVPITYHPRKSGGSKLRSFSDGWRHLKFMMIHTPTHLYFIPGSILTLLGLALMSFTYLRIYIGYSPGFNSMLLGCLFILLGYQIFFLGLFAKLYGVSLKIFNPDKVVNFILEKLSLEKGVTAGLVVFLIGFLYALYLIASWINSGFRTLPLRGESIIAFTLITVGIQTIFNSFFLSMLTELSSYIFEE